MDSRDGQKRLNTAPVPRFSTSSKREDSRSRDSGRESHDDSRRDRHRRDSSRSKSPERRDAPRSAHSHGRQERTPGPWDETPGRHSYNTGHHRRHPPGHGHGIRVEQAPRRNYTPLERDERRPAEPGTWRYDEDQGTPLRATSDFTPRSTRSSSEWEMHTPQRNRPGQLPTPSSASASTKSLLFSDGPGNETIAVEMAERDTERDWYEADDTGETVDFSHNELNDYDVAVEGDASQQQRLQRKVTARQAQFARDNDRWERNRMRMVGVGGARAGGFDPRQDDDHQSSQVQLILHDALPPFMQPTGKMHALGLLLNSTGGRAQTGTAVVEPFRDATSDMAVISRRGSAVVRSMRERRERIRLMRTLEGANTTLGQLMGRSERGDEHAGGLDSEHNPHANPSGAASSDFTRLKSIREQRQFLPAFACRAELLQLVRENPVVVVVGETGSGKTTQLAQYLHEDGLTRGGGLIGCTQPRRVAAMSVARRVSEEMGCAVGSVVGYAIRFEDCTSPATRIKYMTDGVLLRETLRDGDLDAYAAIIIDEAHERSLQTDVLLGLLRQIVQRRRDLRLIVTSATMNAERFSEFFGRVPIYTIPGRTFPVETFFAKNPVEDYVEGAVKQILAIHLARPLPGDILVFMTGQEDIEATCALLEERLQALRPKDDDTDSSSVNKKPIADLWILPIYSQLPADLQGRIFETAPRGVRKCIVATNIAETSLTVDGICYVIDSGYGKVKVYNPRIGMDALQVAPVSQAGANQRAGRAGRTGPGICYRLYTETAFKHELFPAPVPEIQRTNLANVVLLLQSLGVPDITAFAFIDAPPAETTATALFHLWALGALDDKARLTPLGARMVEFPLDPPLAKMLIAAEEAGPGCAADMATIVSMLSVPSVFYRPRERAEESDAVREKFAVPESDHLTLLNVYNQWTAHNYSDGWCAAHFIHARAMRKAREVRDQLVSIMRDSRSTARSKHPIATTLSLAMSRDQTVRDWDLLRCCIAQAYAATKATRMKSITEYVNLRTGTPCMLHPTSAIFGLGFTPECVVYHELIMTSREYMHCVTAVDPAWLAAAAPMFYSLRITEFTAAGNISSARRVNLASAEKDSEAVNSERDCDAELEMQGGHVVEKPSVSLQTANETDIADADADLVFASRLVSRTPRRRGL